MSKAIYYFCDETGYYGPYSKEQKELAEIYEKQNGYDRDYEWIDQDELDRRKLVEDEEDEHEITYNLAPEHFGFFNSQGISDSE